MKFFDWLLGRNKQPPQSPVATMDNCTLHEVPVPAPPAYMMNPPPDESVLPPAPKPVRKVIREVVLDFETTGLSDEDRVIELGMVELLDGKPNLVRDRVMHTLVNPEGRKSHPMARKVHGISSKELDGKPTFSQIAHLVLDFIGDANIVAHNADFEMRMLNNELSRANREPLPKHRFICTMKLSQEKFGGSRGHRLDDLMERFGMSDENGDIKRHRALDDTILLAVLYPKLRAI
jgi:DNA polymerase-3 subunit epsilon